MNLYDFTVKDMNGNDVPLSNYAGKTVLVVNTATGCGFTPQYAPLQAMYDELHGDNFEILDFPCNQFANQAPGDNAEIKTFCEGRFGVTFPQFAKIDVNGEEAIPLYKWLTSETKFAGFQGAMGIAMKAVARKMDKDYKNNGAIKWNFTKFLINSKGEIVERFEPTYDMKDLKAKVVAQLLEG